MVVYKKNFFQNVPDWNTFINALSYKYNNPNEKPFFNPGPLFVYKSHMVTDIMIYNKFDPQYWDIANSKSTLFLFEELKKISNFFYENITEDFKAKAILNFVGNESKYSVHKDPQDVISWQCIGNIEYRIYEDVDSDFGKPINPDGLSYESYFMSPGDIIYMPPGTVHQVVVTEPRATILFDFTKTTSESLNKFLEV